MQNPVGSAASWKVENGGVTENVPVSNASPGRTREREAVPGDFRVSFTPGKRAPGAKDGHWTLAGEDIDAPDVIGVLVGDTEPFHTGDISFAGLNR